MRRRPTRTLTERLILLALRPGEEPRSIEQIAAVTECSPFTIRKTCQAMTRADVLARELRSGVAFFNRPAAEC